MSNNFPRIPVRYLETNQELLKSQYGSNISGASHEATDYRNTEEVATLTTIPDQYRAPLDRMHGNEMARRNPDGTLDIDYMKHKVLDALKILKNKGTLNAIQELALSCVFPTVFQYVDPALSNTLARVNLKISPEECSMIAFAVADHLCQEHELLLHYRQ